MSALSTAPSPDLSAVVLNLAEIQGNILAGFNKDHQRFLFLRIEDAAKAKIWLKDLLNDVSDTARVKAANDQRKVALASGTEPENQHWLNIAFNFPGLQKLGAQHLSQFPTSSSRAWPAVISISAM